MSAVLPLLLRRRIFAVIVFAVIFRSFAGNSYLHSGTFYRKGNKRCNQKGVDKNFKFGKS